MALFRLAFLMLAGAGMACWVGWKLSGDEVWRQRGRQVLRWLVVLILLLMGYWVLRRGALVL